MSSSGGSLSTTENADAYGEERTTTAMTSTFTANTAGTYTVSFSGTIAGSDLSSVPVSGSVTINVTAPSTPDPEPDPGSGSNTGQWFKHRIRI